MMKLADAHQYMPLFVVFSVSLESLASSRHKREFIILFQTKVQKTSALLKKISNKK